MYNVWCVCDVCWSRIVCCISWISAWISVPSAPVCLLLKMSAACSLIIFILMQRHLSQRQSASHNVSVSRLGSSNARYFRNIHAAKCLCNVSEPPCLFVFSPPSSPPSSPTSSSADWGAPRPPHPPPLLTHLPSSPTSKPPKHTYTNLFINTNREADICLSSSEIICCRRAETQYIIYIR